MSPPTSSSFHIDRVAAAARGSDPEALAFYRTSSSIPHHLPRRSQPLARPSALGRPTARGSSIEPVRDHLKQGRAAHIPGRRRPRAPWTTRGRDHLLGRAMPCSTPCSALLIQATKADPTHPTHVCMVNRVRLVGAHPRFAPLLASTGVGRLDLDARVTRLPGGDQSGLHQQRLVPEAAGSAPRPRSPALPLLSAASATRGWSTSPALKACCTRSTAAGTSIPGCWDRMLNCTLTILARSLWSNGLLVGESAGSWRRAAGQTEPRRCTPTTDWWRVVSRRSAHSRL